jgi:regulator of protease activity HflC (stomatin/prohibitin superfamily)
MDYYRNEEENRTLPTKKIVLASVIGILVIVFLCCIGSLVEDVNNEDIVVNQVPITGTMDVWVEPGMYAQKFGHTTQYHKTEQFWFGGNENGNPIPVTFNDMSNGEIFGSLRVKLPTDREHMLRIQTDYNGKDRLMNDLVRPTVEKVVYASGPLMSAYESVSEKKNNLIEYITDQLNNGVYTTAVKISEVVDPITGEKKQQKFAILIEDSTAAGGYRRSEKSPFEYYGIEIGQVSVPKIDYEERVKKQIEQQQEANMLVQTSKAKSLAAQQEAIRAEEEGKAQAAKAKWEQEKIKAVEVTKAEQEYEVARLAALKANEEKKKIIAEGQAQAEANRLKVAAGLTPQEKMQYTSQIAIGVAEAMAKSQVSWVPSVMIVDGKTQGGVASGMDAVGLKMYLDIADKIATNASKK